MGANTVICATQPSGGIGGGAFWRLLSPITWVTVGLYKKPVLEVYAPALVSESQYSRYLYWCSVLLV